MKRMEFGVMLIVAGVALAPAGSAVAGDDRLAQGPGANGSAAHGPMSHGLTGRQTLSHPSMAREPAPGRFGADGSSVGGGRSPARTGGFDHAVTPDTRRGSFERRVAFDPRPSPEAGHARLGHGFERHPQRFDHESDHRGFARGGEGFGGGYERDGHERRSGETRFSQDDRQGDGEQDGRGFQGREYEQRQFERRPYDAGYTSGYGEDHRYGYAHGLYGHRYGYRPFRPRFAHGMTYRRYAGYGSYGTAYQPSYSYAPYGYPSNGYASSGYAGGEYGGGQGPLGTGIFSLGFGSYGDTAPCGCGAP